MSTPTMISDTDAHPLHVLFFPLMAPGHMTPMVDIAKLFASRGIKTTILTTPANAPLILPTISTSKTITLSLIPFPSTAVGLPDGCENTSSLPLVSQHPLFLQAVLMLRGPFDQTLTDLRPDCVVTDTFLPWTQTVAADHNIPRLVFHGMGFFSLCAIDTIDRHGIEHGSSSSSSSSSVVILPGLPHRIQMLREQIPDWSSDAGSIFHDLMVQVKEHEPESYGVVVNSFYELEPDYAKHYREVVGRRAWHIGPVSLCNKVFDEMRDRGSKGSIDWKRCSDWLDTKDKSSVVYVCFGSGSDVPAAQLREIAIGLEASGHPFIWAVKAASDGWMPDGYEERIEGRGMVIRGWAPQIMILDHPAIGGFVTHCGWNSTLEGVAAGLPMATWPLDSEQFYNERMVVDVLGIGVAVGLEKHAEVPEEREVVAAERVGAAVRGLMGGGEKAEERRRRARELGEMARRAVEEGGSSCLDLENLIQELLLLRVNK